MSLQHHMHPDALETYAFWWSEARLIIAALALLLGGTPPILYLASGMGVVITLLKLSWIISGVAAVYLLYRWISGGQKLFGHKNTKDTIAFFVMVVSGINLGLVGLIGNNIGMSIASSYAIFIIVAVIYLVAAYHLYTRRTAHGRMF